MPHLHQATRRELEVQVEVEDRANLVDGYSQAIVQPARQHQNVIANLGSRQSVRHLGFDPLAALGAPIAVNRVLGDDGLDVLGNVFDDARPRFLARRHLALAGRAPFQPQNDLLMNDRWRRPTTAWMPVLATGLLASQRRGVLVKDRLHSRRRGRRISRLALLLGQQLGHLQQSKDHRLGPLLVDGLGFLGGELRTQSNLEGRNDSVLLAACDGKKYPKIENRQRSAAYG